MTFFSAIDSLEPRHGPLYMQIERILTGIDGIAFHYLNETDVIRHRLVREIIKAYAEDAGG